ncbi:MAG: hypothetical protein JO082_07420 [Mycobacterium sp.]|nr:hypothetical protein [Mycobacterium sp.]
MRIITALAVVLIAGVGAVHADPPTWPCPGQSCQPPSDVPRCPAVIDVGLVPNFAVQPCGWIWTRDNGWQPTG